MLQWSVKFRAGYELEQAELQKPPKHTRESDQGDRVGFFWWWGGVISTARLPHLPPCKMWAWGCAWWMFLGISTIRLQCPQAYARAKSGSRPTWVRSQYPLFCRTAESGDIPGQETVPTKHTQEPGWGNAYYRFLGVSIIRPQHSLLRARAGP